MGLPDVPHLTATAEESEADDVGDERFHHLHHTVLWSFGKPVGTGCGERDTSPLSRTIRALVMSEKAHCQTAMTL